MSTQTIERPRVFEYTDAISYIQDFVTYLQSTKKLSKNKIVQTAGFKSPSYLDLLISKQRALTDLHIDRLCKAFELSKGEAQYFHLLGLLTHQESIVSRDLIEQKMSQLKSLYEIKELQASELSLFKAWFYPAALLYLGKISPEISEQRLMDVFSIGETEAKEAIEDLESLGLIERNGKVWKRSHLQLETPKSPNSDVINNFHQESLQKAIEHLVHGPVEERNFQNLVLDLNESDFKGLGERVWDFIKSVQNDQRKKPDRVYQLSIQLFPLSKKEGS